MRIFHIDGNAVSETSALGELVTRAEQKSGYLWISCTRSEFQEQQHAIQATLHALCGIQLVDLHISDLLNAHIPSQYDYTAQYNLLIFRRLAAGNAEIKQVHAPDSSRPVARKGGPTILRRIDTNPVGFAVFDQILLTVHPADCPVRDAYAARLLTASSTESRAAGVNLPTSPADLMLRIINLMVDGFLELRRELTHQLDHWQSQLLDPKSRFNNWGSLLEARLTLHYLDEICEDQRAAIQDWIEAVNTWPEPPTPQLRREYDLLKVRSRDVLEHIERVVHHVRRLEQSAETAVQMHFNAQGNRTNDIMRTLTALTAIFLPLNLIAGIFGMNFVFLPLIHQHEGFWWAMGAMITIATGLGVLFWRKHYLARTGR
jgi:magnesium transporter